MLDLSFHLVKKKDIVRMAGFFSQPGAGSSNPWTLSSNEFRTAHQQLIINGKLNGNRKRRDCSAGIADPIIANEIRPVPQEEAKFESQSQPTSDAYKNVPTCPSKRLGYVFAPFRNPMMTKPGQISTTKNASNTSNSNHHYEAPTVSNATVNTSRPIGLSRPKSSNTSTAGTSAYPVNTNSTPSTNDNQYSDECQQIFLDERARNLDKSLVEKILNEIVSRKSEVQWSDVAGLRRVKREIDEIIELPQQVPLIYGYLLRPTKGLLLFGPPGTGKTMIGQCIANQNNSTFFSISASSLTSKWLGEGLCLSALAYKFVLNISNQI